MVTDHEHTTVPTSRRGGWQGFWDRGGWWRAVLAVVLYLAIYEGIGWLNARTLGRGIEANALLSSPGAVLNGLTLPILAMGILTLVFVATLGWRREVFGRQPVEGRWWMWIAVAVLIVPIVIRVVATNWSAYSVSVVFAVLFLGLCIGFTEELITRGVAVSLLRRGGYSERVVALLSAVLFGLMHASNAISGANPVVVGATVIYTFGIGIMLYLSMRVTGSIIPAMLLHAATDPTTILATGGIDGQSASAGDAGLLGFAGLFNFLYPILGLLALFLIKGRVQPKKTGTTRVLAPGDRRTQQ
ncbi:CPBP family intramembrane glutamic endopeptidase [Curtobacterium sp. MCSS17_005]|uniref:CPBP family intramembrane glutamic endopeptidase n=1 Tax=Curtobacterium sp. MCSS17_005 TaxID=2175641 RepID=UPI000DA8234A|nr:CPBP family intramembrane glutamic endopeptidase [Curtobacterium sp. MCSS17_005]WIB33080.1 CPBP family intramembrane metalloprotease [Curtobacterium sp. MCSS17_005]